LRVGMCRHIFGKIIFCALHVFLCARVLRPVCARTRAQLRGNIECDIHWPYCTIDVLSVFTYNKTVANMIRHNATGDSGFQMLIGPIQRTCRPCFRSQWRTKYRI